MQMIKNEWISACLMSLIVSILVWWNSPVSNEGNTKGRSWMLFIKTFILSFAITFTLFYFTSDPNEADEVIQNMIKGVPDF